MFREDWSYLRRLMFLKAGGGKAVEDTATGNPLTFLTDLSKPLKSLSIPFTPMQEGTGDPSPSNIRPIVPWNGLTVKHGGKNLFDVSVMSTRTGVTVEGNTFVGSPYNFRGNGGTIPLKIPKGAKITLSLTANIEASTDGAGFAILFDYSDGTTARPFYTRNSEVEPTYHYGTITAEKDVVGYEFAYYNHSDATWTVKDVQIEIGETATAYEPYKPITETDISFASPVYGGVLDVVTGELWKTYLLFSHAVADMDNDNDYPGWKNCTELEQIVQIGTTGNFDNAVGNIGNFFAYNTKASGNTARIAYLPKTVYGVEMTQEKWKEDYPDLIVQFALPLLTPVLITTLTPQQITALVGNNTIWSDADGSMTAVYFKKG